MPRLFIAIDLPDEHKAGLTALRDDTLPGRWTPPAQYHLTVRFIGEVDEDRTMRIEERLGGLRTSAFSLQGPGLGVFPSRRKPRILFAAIDPVAQLRTFHTKVTQALHGVVTEEGPKPFHPHITLARLRGHNPRTVRTYLRKHHAFTLPPFAVAYFYLYESLLHPEGALHQRRAAFVLQPVLPPSPAP